MSGKVVLAGCSAVIALAFCATFTGTSVPVPEVKQLQASNAERRLPAYPPAMGGPDIIQPASPRVAESRKRIVDSADLHAEVSKVTSLSPTIEKLAASESLMACADFRRKSRRAIEEEAAAQALGQRCAGIQQNMGRNDAIEKAIELLNSAGSDSSSLGRLIALSRPSHDAKVRWNQDDLSLISDALRSTDVILVREAARALGAQLNDGSPDANLRMQALADALENSAQTPGDRRAAFDALVACANRGLCDSDRTAARLEHDRKSDGGREQREAKRLTEQYRAALERGIAASELLALR